MSLSLTQIARIAIAAILSLLAIAVVSTFPVLERSLDALLGKSGINSVDGARRSMAYRLDPERPTQFTFSGERELFRLLSSIAVHEDAPIAEDGWIYGYRVSFLDGTGSTIDQRDIFSRGILPAMTETVDIVRFLRTSNERLSVQDEIVVEAPEGTDAITLTSLDMDPGIVGIDVRVSERQPLTDSGALVAFLRRSPGEQRKLIDGSAFPTDTLTDAEMMAVARNSWRPVGPSGIAGEAYQLVVMYEIDVEEEETEVVAAP